MLDESEFESFVFCLAHKRVSSSLIYVMLMRC